MALIGDFSDQTPYELILAWNLRNSEHGTSLKKDDWGFHLSEAPYRTRKQEQQVNLKQDSGGNKYRDIALKNNYVVLNGRVYAFEKVLDQVIVCEVLGPKTLSDQAYLLDKLRAPTANDMPWGGIAVESHRNITDFDRMKLAAEMLPHLVMAATESKQVEAINTGSLMIGPNAQLAQLSPDQQFIETSDFQAALLHSLDNLVNYVDQWGKRKLIADSDNKAHLVAKIIKEHIENIRQKAIDFKDDKNLVRVLRVIAVALRCKIDNISLSNAFVFAGDSPEKVHQNRAIFALFLADSKSVNKQLVSRIMANKTAADKALQAALSTLANYLMSSESGLTGKHNSTKKTTVNLLRLTGKSETFTVEAINNAMVEWKEGGKKLGALKFGKSDKTHERGRAFREYEQCRDALLSPSLGTTRPVTAARDAAAAAAQTAPGATPAPESQPQPNTQPQPSSPRRPSS